MHSQEVIQTTLAELKNYLKQLGIHGQILYRTEGSHLVRAGANQISLNSYEENEKLYLTLQKGKKLSQFNLSLPLTQIDDIKKQISRMGDTLNYLPTLEYLTPWTDLVQTQNYLDDHKWSCPYEWDNIPPQNTQDMVNFFQNIYEQNKKLKIETSGMFSAGKHAFALTNTNSANSLFYAGRDYHLESVTQLLNHSKREIKVTDVGIDLESFAPDLLIGEITEHIKYKIETPVIDIQNTAYDIILGKDALAIILEFMNYMSFRGELYEENKGMLRKESHQLNQMIFGENITISDDVFLGNGLYQRPFGLNGMARTDMNLIKEGVLQNFYYSDKISCDRLAHSMFSDDKLASWHLHPGIGPAKLESVINQTESPALYIHNIHYMNFTNLNRGEFTATARFGAYLLQDGKIIGNPGPVRLNLSVFDMLNKVEWLSSECVDVNTSSSYDVRLPNSIRVPKFIKIKNR